MSATDQDWTKPAAMAIPKTDISSLSVDGTDPSFRAPRRATASRSSRR